MLALTQDAAEAIQGILANPGLPESAGVRITPQSSAANGTGPTGPGLQIMITDAPGDRDEVLDAEGARVFLDPMVVQVLDDKVLDASVAGEHVSFMLGEREA